MLSYDYESCTKQINLSIQTTVKGKSIRKDGCACTGRHYSLDRFFKDITMDSVPSKRMIDLTDQRFGKWFVVGYAGRNKQNKPVFECKCDCGNVRVVAGSELCRGRSKSCGCSPFAKHGYARRTKGIHSAYSTWANMKQRCTNPKLKHYKNYGGRGIRVCKRWMESFAYFLADMGEKPSPEHSLERLDNNGGYNPDNCRWATRAEQSKNKRNNFLLTYNGQTKTISGWAKSLGIDRMTLKGRLRRGWPLERALRK